MAVETLPHPPPVAARVASPPAAVPVPPPVAPFRAPGRMAGVRRRARRLWPALGPAFVAAVAYVDPGNFATNMQGGASFGYVLVWVVVLANVVAMLVQYLSSKVGIATGTGLAELCRERLAPRVTRCLWAQAELVAMATDLAEFIGTAVALQLLFGLPPLASAAGTVVVTSLILALRSRGRRRFEVVIAGLLGIVLVGFTYQLLLAPVDAAGAAGGLVPRFEGTSSILLASGIVGATVMPHAVYLHSALSGALAGRPELGEKERAESPAHLARRRQLLSGQRVDVVAALTMAGLVNVAILLVAAATLHGTGLDVDGLESAHHGLGQVLGSGAALVFAVALLASGVSSSAVGTCAGDIVMSGFLRRRVPALARRAATMGPAFLLLALGIDPTEALVISQVVLSFGIPFTLVPLVRLTSSADVMGTFVNRRSTTVAGAAAAALIIGLNGFLVYQVLGV